MDTVFTGRIWKLPDDVDTDTIIPGGTVCCPPRRR